jgi:arylsulfatase A-like enzyme
MKRFLLSLAWLFASFTTSLHAAGKPNVVMFLVDDMGWMDSGAYGSKYYETPNIDRLAKRAMRFTDAYAMPLCSPTRASILSGQYSARHGVLTASGHLPPQEPGFKFLPDEAPAHRPVISPLSKNYLEPSQYTVAEALRDAGWKTAHVGKWHLGLTGPHWPEKQGFNVAVHAHPDAGPASYFSPYDFAQYQSYSNGPAGEYITDRLTDEAIKFIHANREQPFLLHLWHHGVHGPWGHKEEYTKEFAAKKHPRGKQGNPIMASMLRSIDESLGRVLKTLDELKLTDNTLFIFFSDNGGNTHSNTPDDRKTAAKEGGPRKRVAQLEDWRKWAGDLPPTSNDPLRDGKGTLYEGGTRVPLLVMWPGKVPAGTQTDAIVHAVDLYPTILDLVGVKPNALQVIDGISIAPVLRDPKAKLSREAVFNYFPMSNARKPGGVWVRRGDWKLIRWFETTAEYPGVHELYNLREDLGESKNLAKTNPARVKEMDTLIQTFLKETHALVPKPNPSYQKPDAADPHPKTPPRKGEKRKNL